MEKKHSFFMKDKQNSDKIESLVDAFRLNPTNNESAFTIRGVDR